MMRHQVRPNAKRKMIVSDLPDAESAGTPEQQCSLQWKKLGESRNDVGRGIVHRARCRGTGARELVAKRNSYKRARAGAAFDISLGEELSIGAEYGNPRNSQLIR